MPSLAISHGIRAIDSFLENLACLLGPIEMTLRVQEFIVEVVVSESLWRYALKRKVRLFDKIFCLRDVFIDKEGKVFG